MSQKEFAETNKKTIADWKQYYTHIRNKEEPSLDLSKLGFYSIKDEDKIGTIFPFKELIYE